MNIDKLNKIRAENFDKFLKQMQLESDRGSVIVSVSLLDDILLKLIQAKLVPSIEKNDELFDTAMSPFSTFSSKIDLAYRLGLIHSATRASFHRLRKIRNNFAHAINPKGFDSDSTKTHIQEIFKLNKELIEALHYDLLEKDINIKELLTDRQILELFLALSMAWLSSSIEETIAITSFDLS